MLNISLRSFDVCHLSRVNAAGKRTTRRLLSIGLLFAAGALVSACGGLGLADLLPAILGLNPTSVIAGSPSFTLTINGQNFQSAVVQINGQSVQTTSGTNSQLTALVPAALIQNPGTLVVTVVNLVPSGNRISNQMSVTVQNGTPTPVLKITKTHSGSFTAGQAGAAFTLTVSNTGTAATTGMVTATEIPPSALTVTTLSGNGWACVIASLTCTRSDALATGASYPAITVTTNVAGNAPSSLTNNVNVTGGGSVTGSGSDTVNVNPAPVPKLTITKAHTGSFIQGQTGAAFTISVSNTGTGPTDGTTVTATEAPPASLTVTALSGSGWTCTVSSLTCTRSDALNAGSSYPTITVTSTVAGNAPASITNNVSISGGGSTGGTGSDTVTVNPPATPALKITKTHSGNFIQGQTGATFTLTVSNTGTGPSSGTVTATDTPPASLTVTALSGSGWTCIVSSLTCTRSDALNAGSSYPTITVTSTVAGNAPASITNNVSISGGGSTGGTGSDTVTVNPPPTPSLTIKKTHVGNFTQGGTGTYTITVQNVGTGPTSGTVTVSDTIPAGLTAMTPTGGTGWTCSIAVTVGCTRSDALAAGSSYPAITLTVSVSASAPATVTNTVVVSGGGALPATAADPTTINSSSGGTPAFTLTGTGPASATENNNVTIKFIVKNTGSGATSGTVTVQFSSGSSLFTPINVGGDPWTCDQIALSCTRSDVLAAGNSYPAIALTFQIGSGAPSPLTVSATASGGGVASNATINVATPVVNCSPSTGLLCGQFAIFTQGYTSAGPRAVAASFTADGNGHITAGIVDVNSMGAPQTGLTVLTAAPTAYNFESNGFGNVILSTSAGNFVFKFIQSNFGASADVIEYEPSGTAGGSGFMVQQNPTYSAASISGSYALGVFGGLGGASAGVRLGMIGAINANGACGFGASGSTGTVNDGGSVSTAVSFSGTLNPAACSVDPTTGRGTLSLTSITGSPAPPYTTANFVYYVYGTNTNGIASQLWLLSTDQTSATQPVLSGSVVLQANAPYSTNAAIDCGVASNPTSSTGCVFSSSGATGGNSVTGSGHVTAGVATVTTQSNSAGNMSLLLDDNKGGTVNSGTVSATYSYNADGTGVITPSSGEPVAFILTGTDSGFMLGTGGSVAVGAFLAQTAKNLSTSSAANFIAVTQSEGTDTTTNTLVNSTFTPTSPTPSNSGAIAGNTRSWSSTSLQAANTLSGTYSTAPATGRGTGTTSSTNGIAGAGSFVYYVINANSFVLIGTDTSGAGATAPVLMSFQAP
jgi:uncharacterized repeat protein (TIGR01451 family)